MKDIEQDIKEKSLENVVSIMDNSNLKPDSREGVCAPDCQDSGVLTDDDIEAMMADEDAIAAAGLLLDMKRATLARSERARVDVDAEWRAFMKKKRRARHIPIYYIAAGIAAMLVVIAGVAIYMYDAVTTSSRGTVLMSLRDNPQHPVLSIGGGEDIVLDTSQERVRLAGMGMSLTSDGMTMAGDEDFGSLDSLTLTIPRGQTYKLTLADGSEVWMNNDCRLTYPNRFTGKERRVRIEGEAYFKVAPDKEHPFIVMAGGMQVRVYGTEFNIRSYGSGDSHVTLIKGSVAVRSRSHEARLQPGQDAKLNEDESFGIAQIDTESYIFWRDGFFYFDDIPLEAIMQDIGRWYNMTVVMENDAARSYHLHFLADKRGGIDHVIKLLNSMGKVKITRKDNKLIVK
ncbi:MAG: FecR domain-containing protein [Prevotella sp.]